MPDHIQPLLGAERIVIEVFTVGAALTGTLIVLSLGNPRIAIYAVAVVLLLPISSFQFSAPIDIRLASTPFVAVLVVKALRTRSRQHMPIPSLSPGFFLAAAALLAFTSVFWSASPSESVMSAIALLNAALLVWAVVRLVQPAELRTMLRRLLTSVVLLSTVLAPLSVGTLGGRVRGAMVNPNGLGIIAVLLLPFAVTHYRRPWGLPLAGLCLGLVVLSGSRSAAVAIIAEALFAARSFRRNGTRMVASTALLVSIAFVGWQVVVQKTADDVADGGVSITRQSDSRTGQWAEAATTFRSHPLTGVGYGAYDANAANSYLKLLAETGLLGLPILLLALRTVRSAARSSDPLIAALAIGGAVSAFFEAWLFVGGSVFAVLYWLLLAQAAHRRVASGAECS